MKRTMFKRAAFGAAILMGMAGVASAAASLPLQPGFAVHTFGVSPDHNYTTNPDGNATVRIYDTTGRGYNNSRPTANFNDTYSDPQWNIDTIGNVYGIAIDQKRNIYVTASANWSPGYVGTGDTGYDNVPVKYGSFNGGGDNNTSAGRIYKLDASTGAPTVFATLPQTQVNITNQTCQGAANDVARPNVGAGLGNIVYDKFHDQYFVSNFSDGKIYRLDSNGTILETFNDPDLDGIDNDGKTLNAPYGLAIAPDGTKLYYGTIYTGTFQQERYKPAIYAINLTAAGSFNGAKENQGAKLVDDLHYTQNIGGEATNDGVWAAYSDLAFTPDGELLVGVRVGCKNNFATSYNHGGVAYLLKKDQNGHFNQASSKTENGATSYTGTPTGINDRGTRAGFDGNNQYLYDEAAIPLHPHENVRLVQAQLEYGPDDGYGGVAVWQAAYNDFDLYATSSDITTKEGVHGFMQFNGNFTINSNAVLDKAIGYGSVKSSTSHVTTNAQPYDYKGIGGDVEVFNIAPVSIGSYVWYDKDEDGIQDSGEECINGATMTLQQKDSTGHFVAAKNINGGNVPTQQTTTHNGQCGTYMFDNLPEGDYRVCVAPPTATGLEYVKTNNQVATDNNDAANDTNIATTAGNTHCSGTYSLYLNVEPTEAGGYVGDNQDDAREKWGNMTVDFGFIKHEFDLALVKKIQGSASKKYNPGDIVKFTITVYNQGTVEAKNVKVMDYIPSGLILHDSHWTKSGDKAVLNAAIPSIAAGSSKDVEIEFQIDPNLQSESDIVNVAEIKSAANDFNLLDKDSTPDDKACYTDLANDNDTADTHGCDDLDPAVVHIQRHSISPDTDTPGGGGDEADPDCDCTDGNAADAMSSFALLLMLLGTLAVAMRFLPRDEQQAA